METIEIGGLTLRVIRSRRRTVCMRVAKDGVAEVLSPLRISEKILKETVAPYAEKLLEQLEERRKRMEAKAGFTLTYGVSVRFLGGERTICEGSTGRIGYDENGFYIPPELDSDEIRDAVIAVYKLAARDYISGRVDELAPMLGCQVKSVKINSATSHWASCSRKDTLNFSWFCIMAEPEAVDYVIIHELCHMHEFNHSARFWSLVSEYCPNYKIHKAKLKALWQEFECENWK